MRTKTRKVITTVASVAAALAAAAITVDLADRHDGVAGAEPAVPQVVTTTTADVTTTTTTAAPVQLPSTTTTTPSRPTTTTTTAATGVPISAAGGALRRGDSGTAVAELQRRLRGLGYWMGAVDGTFGYTTEQAVTAFQKVEGLSPDGVFGSGTRAALAGAERPTTAAGGDLVEVDKARQVLFVVRGGGVQWTLNVSTGTERPYVVNGRTEMADTPEGRWTVSGAVNGSDVGELGALYRPRYFHEDGIAVHGHSFVPAYPASHGCVRVTEAAMDWIWANDLMPLGSAVWVHSTP